MPSKKKWYVEALTAHTNEVIATDLPTENAHKNVLCQDSMKRDLWECKHPFISKLLKNETALHLEFKVFYRVGEYGPIKPWPFLRKRRLTLAKALEKGLVRRAA